MKLVVFGATGRTGQYLVQQALSAGYEITAFARTPSKLHIKHPNLTFVQGDVTNADLVEQAIAGADAVLSVLGPTNNQAGFAVTKGTENILAGMKRYGVRRLVISAGAGVSDPNDRPKLIHLFFTTLVKLLSPNAYEDMLSVANTVRASEVDWTIVRVPRLSDAQQTGNILVGYMGIGVGTQLSRADMADFMLRQVNDTTYLHKAPAISN